MTKHDKLKLTGQPSSGSEHACIRHPIALSQQKHTNVKLKTWSKQVLAYLPLDFAIDIESLQNRLPKVCHVPATNACLPRLLFYFFAAAVNSTNESNKAGSMCC